MFISEYLAERQRERNGVFGVVLYGEGSDVVEGGDESVHSRSFSNCEHRKRVRKRRESFPVKIEFEREEPRKSSLEAM